MRAGKRFPEHNLYGCFQPSAFRGGFANSWRADGLFTSSVTNTTRALIIGGVSLGQSRPISCETLK